MRRGDTLYLVFTGLLLLNLLSCNDDGFGDRDFPGLSKVLVSNVSPEGASFQATLLHGQLQSVISYGFLWSVIEDPTLEDSERIEFQGVPEQSDFSASITSTLNLGWVYYVKAFVRTENLIVYSTQEQFKSLGSGPPDVYSITPESAFWGDTISIRGAKFSSRKIINDVFFEDKPGLSLSSTDSLIKVIVPPGTNGEQVKITVSIFGNTSENDVYFRYEVPQMPEIEPLEAYFFDTLKIRGRFSGREEYLEVQIGEKKAPMVFASQALIKVKVPADLKKRENQIFMDLGGTQFVYEQIFNLKAPEIQKISSGTVFRPNDTIEISGRGFNPFYYMNELEISGKELNVIRASTNALVAKFPGHMWPSFYLDDSLKLDVKVSAGGQFDQSEVAVHIRWRNPWHTGCAFPGTSRIDAQAFTIDDKIYYGTGISIVDNERLNDFWEYDPALDQWTEMAAYPGAKRSGATSFVKNGKAFLGLGEGDRGFLKDFYIYSAEENKWTKSPNFRGAGRRNALSFIYGAYVYVGTGYNNAVLEDLWVLDPETNDWLQTYNFVSVASRGIGINIGSEAYVKNRTSLYRFTGSRWIRENGSFLDGEGINGFSFRGDLMLGFGKSFSTAVAFQNLYKYDLKSGIRFTWPLPENESRISGSVVVLDDRAYIFGGNPDTGDVLIFNPE